MSKARKKSSAVRRYRLLVEQIKRKKGVATVYLLLRAVVIVALVFAIFRGNYENAFVCYFVLVLFLLPECAIIGSSLKGGIL